MVLDHRSRPARPWLSVILDDSSRAVPGYTVFLDAPTALQTALALHQAVWHKTDPHWDVCGLPDVLYSDHGADFTSEHLAQVCHDTHIQLIHSTPGVPQGRGKIERCLCRDDHHRTAAHAARLYPARQARQTGHRADAVAGRSRRRARPVHRRELPPARPLRDRTATRDALVRRRLATPHARLTGPTRPAAAHRRQAPSRAPRRRALSRTALPRPTLAAYVGEPSKIRYDPRDLAEIRIYHQGRLLCRAVAGELAAATITLKDLQAARTARRRELRTQLTRRRSLAEELTANAREPIPPGTPLTTRDTTPCDQPLPDEPAKTAARRKLWLYHED